jgi:type VI secretion system secreted protein VgrG
VAGRQTKLLIDLGKEQVNIRRIEASEALGRPFAISLDIVAPHGEIYLLPHLGKPAGITLYQDDELMRHFNGVVVEGEYLSEHHDGFHYRLSLRPWTYLMAHNRDFAIFQDKTVVEIAKIIFGKYPLAKVDYGRLKRARSAADYCVQYGESDFAFVTRLFEEHGIYYHFEHSEKNHEMVLCEEPGSHATGKPSALTYNPTADEIANVDSAVRTSGAKKDFITHWTERVLSGGEAKVTLRDFNFEQAGQPLQVVADARAVHPHDTNEVYDFPGRYAAVAAGQPLGQIVLDSLRANRQCYSGESQALSVGCGRKFSLKDHPNSRFNNDYLITRTHHVTTVEVERSGADGSGSSVSFEAVPADVQWHIMPTVPRPVVKGPETAIVTGPSGEEIFTDKFGRIKVRFHWDRGSTPGESSTCWIRVSQTGGLGNIILPRVGHEVIVDFLHGDPDRPIVVGRVFNSLNMPVYALPDNKTKALWRTKSYKSGQSSNLPRAEPLDVEDVRANELRFEDKSGEEEVFLHAERDMNVRVRFKESHAVGLDQEIKVGQDRKEYVKRNEEVKVDGGRSVAVKETDTLDVKKKITVDSGTEIAITAKTKITLTVGQSSITIDPSGIKIIAPGMAEIKSPMTTVKGDGMLTLKGGMTMIN